MNKAELSRHFNVSVPSISNWISKGMPYISKGDRNTDWNISPKAAKDWLAANGLGAKKKLSEDYAVARTEKMVADAAMATFQKERLEGTLVLTADVEEVVAAEYSIIRSHVRGLANLLPALLVGQSEETISKIITKKVDTILRELSDPETILEGKAESDKD